MHPGGTLAYLLLGTNLGNREEYLENARRFIAGQEDEIVAVSSVYETEPWGTEGQPAYLNQAVVLHTALSPELLLRRISDIETRLGRVRRERWGNRTIDIDILYYGSLVIRNGDLQIPHLRLHLRNFALYPLVEVAPDYIHPVLNKSNLDLLNESKDISVVHKL